MITEWLQRERRTPSSYKFNVFDISCAKPLDDEIKKYLSNQTLIQYKSINQLKRMFSHEAPEMLIAHLRDYVFPDVRNADTEGGRQIVRNVRQGDFGEILTSLAVEAFTSLSVPISKLRYKFNNSRSVFCTDLIAHNKGKTITNIRYYEVKTRTSTSVYNVGIEAYNGLVKDENKPAETIANFLSNHYHEIAEEIENAGADSSTYYSIASQFSDIVKRPEDYNRSFEIVLIIETSNFKERLLEKLNEIPISLSPLEVTVILVDNLNDLIVNNIEEVEKTAIEQVYERPYETIMATTVTT